MMLFLYDQYYPSGGFNDFKGCHPSVDSAKAFAAESIYDKYQIVSGTEIIESGSCEALRKAAAAKAAAERGDDV